MTDRVRAYLNVLYDEREAEMAFRKIKLLLAKYAREIEPDNQNTALSEKDAVLITYGNTLTAHDEVPLRTLNQFTQNYLKDVFTSIHILPFYPYSSDDGFSVIDYYAVDAQLGTWEDIRDIGQGFGLMVDAVFNHMSAQSEWFKAFLAGDPDFQTTFRTESPAADLSSVVRPRATPLLTPFQKSNGETTHVWTTFSADQVDLDASSPETVLRLLDVLLFYIKNGARIIRLDAIAFLWKIIGTSCIHLEQTHTVIKLMRSVLDEIAPGTIIITETNVPHKENVSYFGSGDDEAHMVYNFTLPPMLVHTFLSGNASRLHEWVNTLKTPSNQTSFFNFTASHDGIGVRPVEGILSTDELNTLINHVQQQGGYVSYKQNSDGSTSPYELNITYVDAMIYDHEPESRTIQRFVASQLIAMSLAGVPAIYIHSLLGSQNDQDAVTQLGYNRAINRAKLNYADVQESLNDQTSFRSQIFAQLTNALKKRGSTSAFHPNAAQESLDLKNKAVFALLRGVKSDSERVLVLCNVSDTVQLVDLSDYFKEPIDDLLEETSVETRTTLHPYQVRWLKFPTTL